MDNSMKTIIFYATKHGAARDIAQRIADKIGGADLHDLKQSDIPDFAEYDCVIVGSSIYAGNIRKEAKAFLSQNVDALKGKRLGIFMSGMGRGDEKEALAAAFPKALLKNAKAASVLGGIFDPQKAGFIEWLVMRIITGKSEYIETISDAKISDFVDALIDGMEGQ